MAQRKPFLLRIDPAVLGSLQRWAADDLRSLNAQIEFVLRQGLHSAGRLPKTAAAGPSPEPRAPEAAPDEDEETS